MGLKSQECLPAASFPWEHEQAEVQAQVILE